MFTQQNIWCINLKERADRFREVNQEFEKAGIKNVSFLHPEKHPQGGRHGCWLSHIECYKAILENKDNTFGIIFEDDVTFEDGICQKIEEFVLHNKDWDILWLGNLVTSFIEPSVVDGIWKCNSYNTHAYVITRNYMETLLSRSNFHPDTFPNGLDDYFHCYPDKFYCPLQQICYQSNSPTDNQWFEFNLFQKLIQNGYTWTAVQKTTNFIARHIKPLPVSVQEIINPIPCLITVHCWITELLKKYL